MPASEETGSGPVIHDHRRIDPVTGQVRGKHVERGRHGDQKVPHGWTSSRGPRGARCRASQEPAESSEPTGSTDDDQDFEETPESPEEAPGDGYSASGQGAASRPRTARRSSRSEPRTRSDCRPSTPTTASVSTGDRAAVKEQAVAGDAEPASSLWLDARDQAREHGELSGGFKSVADSAAGSDRPARPGDLRRKGRPVRPQDP